MMILNLTPDSFWESSRVTATSFKDKFLEICAAGADIIDIGAVSSRPGAGNVDEVEEWRRLEPALQTIAALKGERRLPEISIDTTRSGIVLKAFELMGPFMVNDISAGEEDNRMLPVVGELKLPFVAMHKRGCPETMDGLTNYPEGVVAAVRTFFEEFAIKAESMGVKDWIVDPGFGFAKTFEQNLELLLSLKEFKSFGRPVLAGVADKRFTRDGMKLPDGRLLTSDIAEEIALQNGADIIRTHYRI